MQHKCTPGEWSGKLWYSCLLIITQHTKIHHKDDATRLKQMKKKNQYIHLEKYAYLNKEEGQHRDENSCVVGVKLVRIIDDHCSKGQFGRFYQNVEYACQKYHL